MATDVNLREETLLAKANLAPPRRLDTLQRPAPLRPPIHLETIEARSLLASQRPAHPATPSVTAPARPWENVRLSKSQSQLEPQRQEADPSTWVFTDDEVATVIDALLVEYPLRPVGVAQAVAQHAIASSLDQLWRSRHGADQHTEVPWLNQVLELNTVTSPRELEYVRLLCEIGIHARVLNAAFRLAFDKGCVQAMGLLLSFGADASECHRDMANRLQFEHLDMIRLFLTAPCVLPVEVWRRVLHSSANISPAVLLQCLSHRPTIANERMLTRALSTHNFSATAVVLAYTKPDELARYDQVPACNTICQMGSSSRYAFFELLIEAGFISDNPTLREEMLRNVQDRESKLVGLLLTAGVSLGVGPRNALKLAVTQMDLEMLDILTHGTFRIAAEALDWIPPDATEQGVLKILGKLSALGLDGEPLNRRLICAVRCRHIREATELVRMGASVDYKQASALQAAIHNSDAAMLDTLLRAACTPKVLSRVVPALVKVRPPQKRLALLEKVLSKGTVPETLGGPLEMLLDEGDEADLECIALLLRYGASPDASDEESTNSVLVAAHHGWLHVLKLLCEASIRPLVLAKAVLVAFRQFSAADNDHDSSLETMRLLLSKGAKGAPVDQALLSAVIRDSRRGILDLLLTSGASANFKQGEAFYKALTNRSSRTFEVLCKTCPPNLTSTQRLMPLAIHQQYYVLSNLNTLLECTQHKRAALDTISAESVERSSDIIAILRCLLFHGLQINGGECKFLRLAVLAVDISLLRDMLALKPSALSLQLAFGATARINKRRTRLDVMKLLLEQASGTEIGQTICIADQTQLAIDGDFEGLRLVLQHGASINHQGGIAVQKAAVSGHLEVLRLLLKHRPGIETTTKACLACLKSFQKGSDFSPDHVNIIYESLLNASAGTDNSLLSNLLQASVQSVPWDVQFPALLLRRGAKVHEQTTKATLEAGSDDLLHLIIRKTSGKELFHLASACEMSAGRRTWILDECLEQDVSQVDKSRALLHSLSAKRIHDLSVADCLLKHGADISFENGEAFKLAIRAQSAEAIKLLGKRLNTRKVANNAFAYASKATFSDTCARFEIYRVLLEGNLVDKSNCYAALKNCFDRQGADFDTIRLLVTKGADPCAASFILTLCTGTTKQFRELCKSVDLNRVVDAVLSTFHDEADAARWFKLCLRERPSSAQITKADLLTRCIKKYPDGEVLAGLILAKSNLASQTVLCSVFPGCAEEQCSVLIWALLSRPRVSNKTVIALLGAGCDIDFATPVTGLSASMACVLDKNRTQILEALLKIRPAITVDNHVPASVLACLGARSGSASEDPINEIGALTLCQASIYLGNIDSYELLMNSSVSDEDDLHLAAWLALPKFVGKLLETHNSNLESEAYSNYTPLAVALETDSGQSYCKVADTEATFEVRRKETIELLAKKSAFTWRHRQRTYVHIALSKGPETTKILLDILDMKNKPWRFTMLVYEDKAGRKYTPYEYVTELMNIQPSEREGLLRCLAAGNLLTTLELAASGGR